MIKDLKHTIDQCKLGKSAAQKALFSAYNGYLFSVCMKYMNNRHQAEEVLQDSWIEIFNGLERYEDQGKFQGWIKTITVRKAWRAISKNKPSVDLSYASHIPEGKSETKIFDQMACEEILDTLDEIPIGSREVFKMYVLDGYTHEEIATIIGISNSTSRAHLSRARKILAAKHNHMNQIFS